MDALALVWMAADLGQDDLDTGEQGTTADPRHTQTPWDCTQGTQGQDRQERKCTTHTLRSNERGRLHAYLASCRLCISIHTSSIPLNVAGLTTANHALLPTNNNFLPSRIQADPGTKAEIVIVWASGYLKGNEACPSVDATTLGRLTFGCSFEFCLCDTRFRSAHASGLCSDSPSKMIIPAFWSFGIVPAHSPTQPEHFNRISLLHGPRRVP